ncbi:MAG: CHAT domain-containing protein [Pseudomonadota bacterium]
MTLGGTQLEQTRWRGAGLGVLLCTVFAGAPALAATLDEARNFHRSGAYEEALLAYDAIAGGEHPDADRAVARNNACAIRTDRGDFAAAEADCRDALTMRRALADWRGVARTLNNLARVLQAQGDGAAARAAHAQSLDINIQRDDAPAQIINRINLAVLEIEERRYTRALDQLAAAEPLVDRVDPSWGRGQRALIALNRAVVLERIGAYAEALPYAQDAVAGATDSAPHLVAGAQLNRGVILRNLGDPASALDAYRAARGAFAARGDRVAAQNALLNEAIVQWRDLGVLEDAISAVTSFLAEESLASAEDRRRARYLATRLALLRKQPDDAAAHIDALAALAPDDALLHDARARLEFARGDLDAAIEQAFMAVDVIERDRAGLADARHRQRLLSDRRDAYALVVDYLFLRYTASGSDDDFFAGLQIAARGKALGLMESGRLGERPVPTPGQRYVETYLAGKHLHVWRLDTHDKHWQTVSARDVQASALRVRDASTQDAPAPAEDTAVLKATLGGGDVLELVVALDGALTDTPLDVVFLGSANPPVIRHLAAIAMDDSAPDAAPLKHPRFLGLARSSIPEPARRHPALRQLPALDAPGVELDAASKVFDHNAVLLREGNATEQAFLSHERADVVHIAGHAVFDARLDDGAVLILGSTDDDQSSGDGLLHPRDIAALDRPARLTVLSACSSARSTSSVGAPVNHLAGAFLASGSRAVLASLWDVDDAVTAVVMEQFYARLAQGMRPHEALHATKMALASQPGWNRTSFWAPWVIYGPSDQPIFTANPARWPSWPSPALVVLALAISVFIRRRQR